jgi:hypothetical protein
VAPDGSREHAGALAAHVARAFDVLEPAFLRLLEPEAVSFEHALHVVVMDPLCSPQREAFERAILAERSFGEPARWQADYAYYAREKAKVAWREGVSTPAVVDLAPARLRPGDLLVEGAVWRHGLLVAASGAQSWFDAACAGMVADLVHAHLRDAVAAARAKGATW